MRGRSASGTLRALQRERHRTQSANASLSPLSSTPMLLCAGVGGSPNGVRFPDRRLPAAPEWRQEKDALGAVKAHPAPVHRKCQRAQRATELPFFEKSHCGISRLEVANGNALTLPLRCALARPAARPLPAGPPEPVDYRGSFAPTLGFCPAGTGLPQKSRPPLPSIGTPAPAPFEPSRSW